MGLQHGIVFKLYGLNGWQIRGTLYPNAGELLLTSERVHYLRYSEDIRHVLVMSPCINTYTRQNLGTIFLKYK